MPSPRFRLDIAAALSVLLIPLMVNPAGYAPAGRSKDGLAWLAAGLLLTLATFSDRPRRPTKAPARLVVPAVLWAVAAGAATLKAPAWRASLAAIAGYAPYLVLAGALASAARRPAGRRRIVRAIAASAALLSAAWLAIRLAAALFPGTDPARLLAPYGEPALMAAYLACALPFCLAVGLELRRPRWAGWAVTLCVAGLVYLMQPFALAAAALALLVTIYALRPVRNSPAAGGWRANGRPGGMALQLRTVVAGGVLGAVLFAGGRVLPGDVPAEPFAEQLGFLRARWTAAMTLFPRRMAFGWGADGYRVHASTWSRDAAALDVPLVRPHPTAGSEWYTSAVEGGLVGAIAWAVLVLSIASAASDLGRGPSRRLSVKMSERPVAAAAFGCVAGFVAQGSVLPRSPLTSLALAACWGLTWGLLVSSRAAADRAARSPFPWRGALRCAAVPLIAVGLGVVAADAVAGTAARLAARRQPVGALRCFAAAAWLDPLEPSYRDAWGRYALQVAASPDVVLRVEGSTSATAAYGSLARREPANGLWKAALAEARAYREPQAAWDDVVAALRLAPQSSTAWSRAATVCRLAGRRQDEKDALRAAITYGPMDESPFHRLAGVFEEEGRPDLVAFLAERARTESQRDPALRSWRRKTEGLSYQLWDNTGPSTWHKGLSQRRP